LAERSKNPAVHRSRVASIVAAIAALMLVYAIAGTAMAQSPSASASAAATTAATPAGSPAGSPAASQPDTAIGDAGTTAAGGSPIAFLLLGIGAVAAVLVYMGMRGSQLRKAPAGSERDPLS
jgi:hypothetical protein